MGTYFHWGMEAYIYWGGGGGGGMGRNLLGDEYPHPPGFAPLEFFVKTVNFGEGFSICNFDHYLVEVRSACEICFIVSDIFLDLL